MSEDAPVNIGAATVWPDPDSAYFAVRRMQTKLHRWAIEEPDRRFGDLYNLVYDPAFLVHAWERVSTNRGAQTAGIDRATAPRIEATREETPAGTPQGGLCASAHNEPYEQRWVMRSAALLPLVAAVPVTGRCA